MCECKIRHVRVLWVESRGRGWDTVGRVPSTERPIYTAARFRPLVRMGVRPIARGTVSWSKERKQGTQDYQTKPAHANNFKCEMSPRG